MSFFSVNDPCFRVTDATPSALKVYATQQKIYLTIPLKGLKLAARN